MLIGSKKIIFFSFLLVFINLILGCSRFKFYSEVYLNSSTALIDGTYASVQCMNLDINQDTFTDGAKIFYKIENGKVYIAFLFYDQDTACAGL